MDLIASNLKFLRENKGLKQIEMPVFAGIAQTTWNNYEKGVSVPKIPDLIKLSKIFDVTIDSMLSQDLKLNTGHASSSLPNNVKDLTKRIPFYDISAIAGTTMQADMQPISEPVGTIDVGDLLRESECAIRVYNDSMEPYFPSGCVVGLKLVRDNVIEYGNVYVIETSDNRYLKRLKKGELEQEYMCHSFNAKDYEPFPIKKAVIVRIYRVVGMIRRNENSFIFG